MAEAGNTCSGTLRVLSDVHLPLQKPIVDDDQHGQHLQLNGAGVRSLSLFGWNVNIYVAGFYSQSTYQQTEQVFDALNESEPPNMQFDFTFLRSISQGRVTEAWQRQLAHSVEHREYDTYQQDVDRFVACFGPIQERGSTETVIIKGNQTIIVDQGVEKGRIVGKDFQRAFLSMWFGNNAVAPDLRDGLLGNHRYERVIA